MGGRGGVLPLGPGQVDPGLTGPGAQQQLSVPPEGQDHLVPGGLLDLLNPQAQYCLLQLPDHTGEADGVKWHRRFPPS